MDIPPNSKDLVKEKRSKMNHSNISCPEGYAYINGYCIPNRIPISDLSEISWIEVGSLLFIQLTLSAKLVPMLSIPGIGPRAVEGIHELIWSEDKESVYLAANIISKKSGIPIDNYVEEYFAKLGIVENVLTNNPPNEPPNNSSNNFSNIIYNEI